MEEDKESKWEFDNVDLCLEDDAMDEHSVVSKEDECLEEGEEDDEPGAGTVADVTDDTFLMMQEPIVEDPREEYCALLPPSETVIVQHPPLHHHHRLYRHTSWTAPGRVSPEPIQSMPSGGAAALSPREFQQHLQCLAMSIRQSEASRKLVKSCMPRTTWRHDSFNEEAEEDGYCTATTATTETSQWIRASFSVDDTRRSLLSLMEEPQGTPLSFSRLPVRRCKSNDIYPGSVARPKAINQRCRSASPSSLD